MLSDAVAVCPAVPSSGPLTRKQPQAVTFDTVKRDSITETPSRYAVTGFCNTSVEEKNDYSILLKACGFVIITIKEAFVEYLPLFDVFIRF